MRSLFVLLFPLFILAQEELQTRTQVLMGTFVSISLPPKYNQEITRSFELLKRIENSLSTYDETAVLANLNKDHHVKYDPYLAEALTLSRDYYEQTNGYFDITIGSISKKLYHFGEEKTYSPSRQALQSAHLDIHGIQIDNKQIITDKNITIDLGGMGKGYGADKLSQYLNEKNITKGTIALSGDIRCLDRCEVYLQSPYSEQTFAKIQSKNPQLSISTSGTYRRFATTQSEHHLINPKTASQGREFVSVSLFTTANNAKIDAYATALSVMSRTEALAFLKKNKEIGFVLVDKEGKILYGNLTNLLDIEWLDYKENPTSPSISKNNSTKPESATSLIHPDTTSPKAMAK
ncbi:FAD:protein FMN transferase [Sulfurovum sp. XTW-4]|uniref:FAD:protein FMN transferase n=1 Tax=Sulfurovum xiamenensis TaxID=3019066 RepID=A0ABT7QQ01_9BACT|nr:FAD:protein FMN transferase [Sulfurovum xiamenensis]MDM5262837.1 FAD:protein FMN transferase [Sulfurovum xiamenensis]